LSPEGSVFGELVFCLAVEEIGQIAVPPRAQVIRVILSELARLSSHLGFIARMAKSVGADTLFHYVVRDREKTLDLFELLTGSRLSLNFLRFGGVSSDVSEGFIERVLEVCDLIQVRLKEYNDLFSFSHAFLKRSANIGVLSVEQIRRFGVTGPNARASGLLIDTRKSHPYSGFDVVDFHIPAGRGEGGTLGDVHDRYLLRLREISQSFEILRQTAENLPGGDFSNGRVDKDFVTLAGEAYARVESPRGLLGCHVVSDGMTKPARVQFRVPSQAHMLVAPELLVGSRLEDLPVILASLDICVSEVDR
jgi:NADH-quinone oxidoreductase subunit D